MSKLRVFLIGVLVGELILCPTLYKLHKIPRIEALPIPDNVFYTTRERAFVMHHVPSLYTKKTDLDVLLTTQEEVQRIYEEETGEQNELLLGFYDPVRHAIVCIDDLDIFIHELNHVFDKEFHR